MTPSLDVRLFERIHHFYLKLIPQARLAKHLDQGSIVTMVQEAGEIIKYGDLNLVMAVKAMHEAAAAAADGGSCGDLVVENALEDAVNAMLSNLRFGKQQAQHLKDALDQYIDPPSLASHYAQRIDQRNALREDYLYACSLVDDSKQRDELKAYLKLKQLATINSINPARFDCEMERINAEGNETEQLKVLLMLSLDKATPDCYNHHPSEAAAPTDLFEVSVKAASQVKLSLNLIRKMDSFTYLKALLAWPVLRTRTINLIRRACTEAQSLSDIDEISVLIVSLLKLKHGDINDDPKSKLSKQRWQRQRLIFSDVFVDEFNKFCAQLFTSFEQDLSITAFVKAELVNRIHAAFIYASSYRNQA